MMKRLGIITFATTVILIVAGLTACSASEENEGNEITTAPTLTPTIIPPLTNVIVTELEVDDSPETNVEPSVEPTPSAKETSTEASQPTKPEKETLVFYYVIGDGVNMRTEPSMQAEVIVSLSNGTEVKYLGNDGDWSKVGYEDSTGYIRSDLLSEILPTSSSSENTAANPSSNPTTETVSNEIEALDSPKIVVKKSDRTLELWDGDQLYDSYSIGLGWEPTGDKKQEGDGRTPEGTYYVCVRNSASRFYLSLGVSYPNKEDAKEALDSGNIDQNTYEQIVDAIDNGTQPPWNTALGGEIMIHGMGGDSDWTAGCIAVDNEIMDILWKYCPKNTPIVIQP